VTHFRVGQRIGANDRSLLGVRLVGLRRRTAETPFISEVRRRRLPAVKTRTRDVQRGERPPRRPADETETAASATDVIGRRPRCTSISVSSIRSSPDFIITRINSSSSSTVVGLVGKLRRQLLGPRF
jgi:hypothetical protein